jgi:hypothetical protein
MATETPSKAVARSPVIACAKAWSKTTKKELANGGFCAAEWVVAIQNFIKEVSAESYCTDLKGRLTSCTCMRQDLQFFDDINDCSFYLKDFACKKKNDRQLVLLEWMRYAKVMRSQQNHTGSKNPRIYLLPASSHVLICSNACARLIGFGNEAWRTVKKAFDAGGEAPTHQLIGKHSNNRNKEFDSLLHDFFIKLEGLAAPRATRLVRDIVGDKVSISLRDNDEDGEIELPTYYTKRSLYKKLAADCHWEFDCSNKGKYSNKRTQLDNNPIEKLPDWSTFHAFWKKNYGHIKIPKPSEDICEDCHKFVNSYKTAKAKSNSRKRKASSELHEDDSNSSGNEDNPPDDDATLGSASVPSLHADDDAGE